MKDIVKTAVILSIIAIIAGALLGVVNHFTYISPEEIINSKLTVAYADANGFSEVEKASETYSVEGSVATLKTIYLPKKGGETVADCYIYNVSTKGFGGVIELLVVVENNKISNIAKVSAAETAGMGDNAFKEKFASQFMNLDLSNEENFVLKKIGAEGDSEIAALSGATITSTAMVNMMNLVATVHRQVIAYHDDGGSL